MPATIYFSGSISGGRQDVESYRLIVAFLEQRGHRVLAGSVTATGISDQGDPLEDRAIFDRDLGWIAEAAAAGGILVAEVSTPSLGVGYEIATARYHFGMPVICLYRPAYTKRCSAMVSGDAGIQTIQYTDGELEEMLVRLAEAIELSSLRINATQCGFRPIAP